MTVRTAVEVLIMILISLTFIVFHKRIAAGAARYNTKHFRWKYTERGIRYLGIQIIIMGCLVLVFAIYYLLHRMGII